MDPAVVERFRADLLEWGVDNVREFPWRDPDASLYEVFVAEFFLTQTPAENVADVYLEFIERFPSLPAVDRAAREDLVGVIEPIGFYNMRADALKQIAAEYETLPDTVEGLTALPRVGPYVANATLCFTFDRALPILDRNVIRVYERVFGPLWPDDESSQVVFAEEVLPKDEPRRFNFVLLDFGAMVCSTEPNCDVCFANSYCHYYLTIEAN